MSEGPTLDLSAASAAAMDQLGGQAESTQTPTTPNAATGQPPVEEPTVEIELPDGKRTLTAKEIRDGYLRQQDYTRKTQEVAEMRRQAEQVYRAYQQMAQEREQLQDFFSNEENVLKLVAQQYGPQAMQRLMNMLAGQQQQPEIRPDSPATVEQAARIADMKARQLEQKIAQLEQQFGKNVDERVQQFREEQETMEYKKVIDPVVSKIFEDNPVLSAVDGMEEVIRYKVFRMNPQTVQEAVAAFQSVAKEQVEKLNQKYVELNKQQAVKRQKLVSGGTEPPGGQAPMPEPRTFRKGNDVDWKGISKQAEEYMRQRGGF